MKELIYVGIGPQTAGEAVIEMSKAFATAMAEMKWTLRSGGAEGMDEAFEAGCDSVQGTKEIFIPDAGFRKRNNSTDKIVHTLDKHLNAIQQAKPFFPTWDKLGTTTQMFLVRNVFALFGEKLNKPANLVVTWNQYEGTGSFQLLQMAKTAGIPAFNLAEPGQMEAVEELVYQLMGN